MAVSFKDLGLHGRLGNSLHQAAATIAHAKRNNDDFLFPKEWEYGNKLHLPKNCFIPRKSFSYFKSYKEPNFHFEKLPYWNNINLEGYFQSFKYWEDYDSEVMDLLFPQHDFGFRDGVTAIHVRRGDYLKFPNAHPVLPMSYFKEAMDIVKTDKYLIFSDDIPWCMENFKGKQFEFSDRDTDLEDLCLMSSCENIIGSNSSFSWWGAMFQTDFETKKIFPKKWFGPDLSRHDTKNLYMDDWIII